MDKRKVGIITSFGKNRDLSKMSLEDCKFPNGICRAECRECCCYFGKIYEIDYKENWVVEIEADGYENGDVSIGRK